MKLLSMEILVAMVVSDDQEIAPNECKCYITTVTIKESFTCIVRVLWCKVMRMEVYKLFSNTVFIFIHKSYSIFKIMTCFYVKIVEVILFLLLNDMFIIDDELKAINEIK